MENEIKESENEKNKIDDNYFKKTFFKRLILNILIIVLSLIAFIVEFFYRKPLFNYSLDFEKNWQEKASKATISMFKFFTKIGGEYLMAVPVIIVICFFTLIKSYVYLTGFVFCLQFHSMMKIWYGNKRPFWEEQSLYKGICDGGFGNPSGHSITTAYLYLTLCLYYKQTKRLEKNYIILIIILIFCLFWMLMIILSRLILGMHSVNQVIYGSSLGVIIFLLIFIVFEIHRMPVSVYKKFFREKMYIFIILGIFAIFIALTIMNNFIFNKNFDKDKYDEILDRLCEKKVAKYRRFNYDGLFGSFTVFIMLGMYLGQIIFWYLIENKYKVNNVNIIKPVEININEERFYQKNSHDEINVNNNNEIKNSNKLNINNNNEIENNNSINNIKIENNNLSNDSADDLINHWNMNRIFLCHDVKTVLLIILTIIICLIPGILFIVISKNANIFVIFIFKLGIPFLTMPLLIYSFGFYYVIKLSCGSKDVLMKRLEENKA